MATPDFKWHSLNQGEVSKQLLTSTTEGLSDSEVEERQKKYGFNELEEKKKTTVFSIFLNQFRSLVVLALLIAAGLSFAMQEYLEMGIIFAVLIVNALIGTFQEYRAEKALEALKKMAATSATVLRDGKPKKIFARGLVPGDIIFLEIGDRVPADARVIDHQNLSINESMLTGESLPSKKFHDPLPENTQVSDRKNMVYKDTIVTSGRAKAIVVATGMNTEIGKVAELLQEVEETSTPLQNKMSGFMKYLGKLVVVGSILVIIIGLYIAQWGFLDTLKVTVAQVVSFIPEGLPIVVTIVLTIGVSAMASKNAIVRKLHAVETLGCVTAICTDKTGTLTKNEMTVKQLYCGEKFIEVTGNGYEKKGGFFFKGSKLDPLKDQDLMKLLHVAVQCNDAAIQNENERASIIGDPTEGALLVVAEKAKMNKKEVEKENPRIAEVQFDSEKKFMATFNKTGKETVANVKGAPETILSMCSLILINGKTEKLTDKSKQEIFSASHKMATGSLRVLGFAYKQTNTVKESELKNMVFIGLSGMQDPPREEARSAVKLCKDAGIKVVMITGDHSMTAKSIGEDLGIFSKNSKMLTGAELDQLSDDEFLSIVDSVSIYARTSSEHKMRIVETLNKKGHVTAMTGDGVNDALAIKKADVGIAMGISGTEVTKESSDMILTDDNFSTIVSAIEEGRGAYQNIKKVIGYLLATNVGEVIFLFGILLSSLFLPEALPLALLPVHILWVNLVTDGMCVVNLAMEPKEKNLMAQRPRNQKEGIVTADIAKFVSLSAFIMAIGTFLIFYFENLKGDIAHARTMAFTTLAMFQLFSALNARSGTESVFKLGLFSNPYLTAGIIISLVLQMAAIYAPFFNEALKTVPLEFIDWVLIFGVASSLLIVFELKKYIMFGRAKKP